MRRRGCRRLLRPREPSATACANPPTPHLTTRSRERSIIGRLLYFRRQSTPVHAKYLSPWPEVTTINSFAPVSPSTGGNGRASRAVGTLPSSSWQHTSSTSLPISSTSCSRRSYSGGAGAAEEDVPFRDDAPSVRSVCCSGFLPRPRVSTTYGGGI